MKRIIGIIFVIIFLFIITGCGCSSSSTEILSCKKETTEKNQKFTETVSVNAKNKNINQVEFVFEFKDKKAADDYAISLRNTYQNNDVEINGKKVKLIQKVSDKTSLTKEDFIKLYTELGYNCK